MKNILSILTLLLIIPFSSYSQKIDVKKLENLKPRNIGPGGMSGRVTSIDVNLEDLSEIYVGTASGGLWFSDNDGITWELLTEDLITQSVGAVKIQQSNPDVIWLGTGEGNPRNSQSSGAGIFKSIDGGRTWQYMGLKETRNIHRIIIHRDNPDIVYAGAQGPAWGDTEERGLYRTTDGGENWEKILYNNERTGIADLVVDPINPNKMFAAMWEYRRWPWFFESGGEGSGLYMTVDGGDNWKELTHEDGLPKGELGRIGLTISKSNPKIVYALIEAKENAFYKSTDGGYTWKKTTSENVGGRPFYYADIYVDPLNENRIYNIHSVIDKSEDGGKNFENFISYYADGVHPDHHAFWINPNNSDHLIDGNDGGLAISKDRGENWRFIENLPVAQFYHINVDNEVPYRVYGGMQDNGSWIGPSRVWRHGGIRNAYWDELMFGDGFDVVPDPSNNRFGFAMWQGGNLGRYDLESGRMNYIRPIHPDDSVELRFNWNAAISPDPFDQMTIYYGSQFVHKSTDRGENWKIISPDLTTDNPEYQKQDSSGGLTYDVTGAENFTTILAISPSHLNDELIWVGTDDGNVQLTRDDGNSWTKVSNNMSGIPEGSWIPQVHPSRFNEAECYVVVNDYRRNDWNAYLMHTTDYGNSWTNILKGKDIDSFVRSFVQDPKEPKLMFLGTEFGLYISIDEGKNWTKWTEGFPSAPVFDMKIQEREDDLVLGTFGRAAWIFDDIKPFRELARKGTDILEKDLQVFETNDAYMAAIRQAAGTRFAGSSIYSGNNEPFGTRFTVNINKPEKKKDKDTTEKKEEYKMSTDSMKIEIYNMEREKQRTLYVKVDSNINRFYWNFSTDGVRRPNQKKPEEVSTPPSGISVLPGNYKAVFTYNEKQDSINFEVKYDPRIEYRIDEMEEIRSLYADLEEDIRKSTEAADKLREAKSKIELFEKMIEESKIEDKDSLKKESKAVKDSIENIMEFVRGKSGLKGIVRRPDNVMTQTIGYANFYLQSAYEEPNSTHRKIVERVGKRMRTLVDKVNNFLDNEWSDYRNLIQNTDLNLFNDIERLKLEE